MTDHFIDTLTRSYPAITEIWLIGSRANGTARSQSDWDYVVFADQTTLNAIRNNQNLADPLVDMMVVYDGNNFEKPWMDGDRIKKGSLLGWKWTQASDNSATYRATKARVGEDFNVDVQTSNALRIYPSTP
jgi:hypothetical protein